MQLLGGAEQTDCMLEEVPAYWGDHTLLAKTLGVGMAFGGATALGVMAAKGSGTKMAMQSTALSGKNGMTANRYHSLGNASKPMTGLIQPRQAFRPVVLYYHPDYQWRGKFGGITPWYAAKTREAAQRWVCEFNDKGQLVNTFSGKPVDTTNSLIEFTVGQAIIVVDAEGTIYVGNEDRAHVHHHDQVTTAREDIPHKILHGGHITAVNGWPLLEQKNTGHYRPVSGQPEAHTNHKVVVDHFNAQTGYQMLVGGHGQYDEDVYTPDVYWQIAGGVPLDQIDPDKLNKGKEIYMEYLDDKVIYTSTSPWAPTRPTKQQ